MARQIEVNVKLNDAAARTKAVQFEKDLKAMAAKKYTFNVDLGSATTTIRAFEAAVRSLTTALAAMGGSGASGITATAKHISSLGASICTLSPMIATNTNAIRTYIHTLAGFGDATVKAAGRLQTTGGDFQRFEVTTQNAAGGLNTFVYSVNEVTGELYRLDTGVKDSIGNMDRASRAADSLGQVFMGALTPGIASSLANMTAFVHAQAGMSTAIVQATGSVTNAAGTWQQFTAAVTDADNNTRTVRYSINTLTNEVRTLDMGIKNGSQAFTTAAQAAEHMGRAVGTINPALATSLSAVRAAASGITGLSGATIDVSGAVNNAAGHWQQYTAVMRDASGVSQTFTLSVNTATGEIRQLDTGMQRLNDAGAKAEKALSKLGTSTGIFNAGAAKSTAEMTRVIQGMTGLESATVRAKGSVTNAAGTFQLYDASVRQADGSMQTFRFSVNVATGEIYQLDKGLKSSTGAFDSITGKAASFIKTMLGFTGVATLIRQTFTELKKVDAELTNYVKVTGASQAQSEVILRQAYDSAVKYGISAESMMSGISAFARAGYQDNAVALAEVSAQLQLVGSMAAEDADRFLIAADAAYKFGGSISELSKIVNYATVIDNHYATTIDNIAEGFTRIASVAAVSGTPIEEVMAALGTISASQQWEGNVTGTALRAIFLAINKDTITEIEEGETVAVEAINSMDDAIKTYAKDEWEAAQAAGKILDPMEAIAALAKSYKEGILTEAKLYQIANSFGGKRYTNALVGIIQNWDMYEQMLVDMGVNTDAADRAMSAALESWDAKLNKLKTTWQSMFSESGSGGIVKWALESAQGILVFCDNLENLIGLVSGLVLTVKSAVKAIKASFDGEKLISRTNWEIAAIAAIVSLISTVASAIDSARTRRAEAISAGADRAAELIGEMSKETADDTQKMIELLREYNDLATQDDIEKNRLRVKEIEEEIAALLHDEATTLSSMGDSSEEVIETASQRRIKLNNESIGNARSLQANLLANVNEADALTGSSPIIKGFTSNKISLNRGPNIAGAELDYWQDRITGHTGKITAMEDTPTLTSTPWLNAALGLVDMLYGGVADIWTSDVRFDLPEYSSMEEAYDDFVKMKEIRDEMASTTNKDGILLSTEYADTYAMVSAYVDTMSGPMDQWLKTQSDINNMTAQNIVLQSDVWKTTYKTEEQRQQAIDTLIDENKDLTEEQQQAVRTFAEQWTLVDGAENATNGLKDGYEKLADAIDAATSAKEKFDKAIKTTKADSANAYIEAYQALQEELSAGRYNSTRAHAAYRMLMGDETYASFGGNASSLATAFGGQQGAWDILSKTYQDQNGNELQGFGLYKLAESYGGIGLSKDAKGNISWDFNESNLAAISARSGISVDILRLFANAMDQYDKNGMDHGTENEGAEDPNTVATNNNTAAIEANTAAIIASTPGGNQNGTGTGNSESTETLTVEPEIDPVTLASAEKKIDGITGTETKTVIIKTVDETETEHAATGKKYSFGGPTLVNDGSGKELIVENGRAYIANGGNPAVVNLSKGAKVYTAEQTRRILMESGIRSAAFGVEPVYYTGGPSSGTADYLEGTSGGITEVTEKTDDEKKSESKGNSGGGSKSAGAGSAWEKISKIIPYILQRLQKALDKQTELIDKQIESIQKEQEQKDQQNQLEEYQRAVIQAQNDLLEAQSNRTVRYLDDNGQWHWMADAKAVSEAEKNLDDSQQALQDYLEELTYQAQIQALEDEKTRLTEEYGTIGDFWSDILSQYQTPTGDLSELLNTILKNGNPTQKNAASTILGTLLPLMTGGSFSGNYSEALSAVAAATGKSGALMPGLTTDEALAALITSSGTNIGQDAMMAALQSIAGTGSMGSSSTVGNTDNSDNKYYYINGVHIGNDIAELPLSEVLERLSLFTNN